VLKKSLTLIANPKKLGIFQFIQEHETFGKGDLCLLELGPPIAILCQNDCWKKRNKKLANLLSFS
jgi:hypothetical protein